MAQMDDVMQIVTPSSDSQYRLVPRQCGSDNVAYVLGVDGRWRVRCFDCGHTGQGSIVRHEDQVMWNKGVRDGQTS